MAQDIPGFSYTGIAAADLTGKEGYGVVIDSNNKIALAGANAVIDGVLRYGAAADKAVTVVHGGIMGVVAGGVIAKGDSLTTDASGKFVVAQNGEVISGRAREVGADTLIIQMLLKGSYGGNAKVVHSVVTIPFKFADADNKDLVTAYTPGFAGKIEKISVMVTDPATTADKTAEISAKIGAVAVTGGAVSLTSANCTPLGAVVDGSAITATNIFEDDDTISIVAADTAATFVEGEGILMIVLEQ